MITCVVEYTIDAAKTEAFERFARAWIGQVDGHGGTHHGYFLPSEGASDRALALFSFPSFADYEATERASESIQIALRPTTSGTRAGACCATSGRFCDRCSPQPPPTSATGHALVSCVAGFGEYRVITFRRLS